jgi:hypothetical protein
MPRCLTLPVACAVALLLAAEQDCAPCGPGYQGPYLPLPARTTSLDCTVTLQGPTRQAAFDCPPPSGSAFFVHCTAPAGLNVVADTVQRYAPHSSGDGGSSSDGGRVSVDFQDGNQPDATTMKSWLGGADFSLSVACGGTQVTELQNQSIGQMSVGE